MYSLILGYLGRESTWVPDLEIEVRDKPRRTGSEWRFVRVKMGSRIRL